MNLKEILKWRYSTKQFDQSKPVLEDQVTKILELTNDVKIFGDFYKLER